MLLLNGCMKKKGKERMPETERLILRRWEDSDAENLFRYASDPAIPFQFDCADRLPVFFKVDCIRFLYQ